MAEQDRPSPFTVPEPQFKFVEGPATKPLPPRSMSVGNLIQNLAVFADIYESASAEIDRAEPVLKPRAIGSRDLNVGVMQQQFRATLAIDRVRSYVLVEYGQELTIVTARRVLGDLVRKCSLTLEVAEALGLEDAIELLSPTSSPAGPEPVVVNTAGDLWKALSERRPPAISCSSISLGRGASTPEQFCSNPADEEKRKTLDRVLALVTIEGGEKPTAMERLIAKVRLKLALDKASVINMPLANFVLALDGDPEDQSKKKGLGEKKALHNADFTMVNWFGTEFHFSLGVQSTSIRALWEEWEQTGLGLHQETIRERVDSARQNFRLANTFRGHSAWGTMIVKCGDGRYKLEQPASKPCQSGVDRKKSDKKRQKRV